MRLTQEWISISPHKLRYAMHDFRHIRRKVMNITSRYSKVIP